MIITIPQAMERLQIGSRPQLSKLLATRLLPSLEETDVDALAAWPRLELDPDEYGIAVHLSSYQQEEQSNDPADGSQRRWYGWERGNPKKLTPHEIEQGWVGYWPVSEVRGTGLRNGLLVGSIAGFIPRELVRRIEGYVSFPNETSRIVFKVRKLDNRTLDRIGNTRIVAKRGGIWQTL